MAVQENPYPLRVEKPLMEKLRFLSKESGRSINKEIEFGLKKYVEAYEKEHGPIAVAKENQQ